MRLVAPSVALALAFHGTSLAADPVPYAELPLDGASTGMATKVNNAGQIIGDIGGRAATWTPDGAPIRLSTTGSAVYDLDSQGRSVGYAGTEGVVWGPDGAVLRTLGHGTRTVAYGISELGDVVGMSGPSLGETGNGWFWSEDGGFVDLATPTGTPEAFWPVGPNAARQVTGYYRVSSGVFRTFFWSDATGLVPVATENSSVSNFNDAGVVVGTLDPLGDAEAFSWTFSEGLRRLGRPTGGTSVTRDVNESGQICGAGKGPDGVYRLLTWDADGTMHDRGTFGGQSAYARAMNEHGQIVGDSGVLDGQPWFWSERTGFVALDHPPGTWTYATGINDFGRVVGFSRDTLQHTRALAWQVDLGPQIHAGPATVDFGLTPVGETRSALVTVSNVGSGDLVVDDLSLSGDAGWFGIGATLPLVVAAGTSADVPVSFAPIAAGAASATLSIHSDDAWRPVAEVVLAGEGVAAPPPQDLAEVLDWFDAAVAEGALVGSGPGRSAAGRLGALRGMLEAAGEYLAAGDVDAARGQLLDVLHRVDGDPQPPDFAEGEAAAELALLVADLLGWL